MKLPLSLSLFAGLIYLFTAPPGMLWLDAPAYIAVMTSLGVHNTAAPLYVLIGHLFTSLPFGTLIFRAQLLSVVLAVIALVVVYFLVLNLVRNINAASAKNKLSRKYLLMAAAFGLLVLAFSYSFWSQAQNVETFILVAGVTAAVLLLLVKIYDSKTNFQNFMLIAVILGLATGTNLVVLSVAPSVLLGLAANRKYLTFKRFLVLAAVGIFCVVGIHAYIPIRANADPFFNWGRAIDAPSVVGNIIGVQLNAYSPESGVINGFTGSPQVFFDTTLYYFEMLMRNFTPFVLPFILLGLVYLGKKSRYLSCLFLLTIFTNVTLSGLYFSGNRESWFLVSWVVFAALAGLGFWVVRRWPLLLIFSLAPMITWWPALNRQDFYITSDYIENLYRPIEEPAILVGSADIFGSNSYYVHDAYKPDLDITPVIDNIFYLKPWYRENLSNSTQIIVPDGSGLLHSSQGEYSGFMNEFFSRNIDRYKIYITIPSLVNRFMSGDANPSLLIDPARFKLVQQGMVFQLVPKDSDIRPNLAYFDFKFKTPDFPNKQPHMLEKSYRAELSDVMREYFLSLSSMGSSLLKAGKNEEAQSFFNRARAFDQQ